MNVDKFGRSHLNLAPLLAVPDQHDSLPTYGGWMGHALCSKGCAYMHSSTAAVATDAPHWRSSLRVGLPPNSKMTACWAKRPVPKAPSHNVHGDLAPSAYENAAGSLGARGPDATLRTLAGRPTANAPGAAVAHSSDELALATGARRVQTQTAPTRKTMRCEVASRCGRGACALRGGPGARPCGCGAHGGIPGHEHPVARRHMHAGVPQPARRGTAGAATREPHNPTHDPRCGRRRRRAGGTPRRPRRTWTATALAHLRNESILETRLGVGTHACAWYAKATDGTCPGMAQLHSGMPSVMPDAMPASIRTCRGMARLHSCMLVVMLGPCAVRCLTCDSDASSPDTQRISEPRRLRPTKRWEDHDAKGTSVLRCSHPCRCQKRQRRSSYLTIGENCPPRALEG